MAIKDILLPLVGEPSAAAIAAIDKCMAAAGNIGARVTAVAVEEDVSVRPKVMISADLDNTAAAEAVQSASNARSLLKAFGAAATRFGVRKDLSGLPRRIFRRILQYLRGSRICRSSRSSPMTADRKRLPRG